MAAAVATVVFKKNEGSAENVLGDGGENDERRRPSAKFRETERSYTNAYLLTTRFVRGEGCEEYEDSTDAIIRIQAMYRGNATRKSTRKLFRDYSYVKSDAVRSALDEVGRYAKGWRNLLCHFFLLGFVFITMWQQLFSKPSVVEMHKAMQDRVENIQYDGLNTFADATSVDDVLSFVDSAIDSLYSPDPHFELTPECTFPADQCDVTNNDTEKIKRCSNVTEFSGMLDEFNRHQFGLIIVQKRWEMTECVEEDLYSGELGLYTPEHPDMICANNKEDTEYDSVYLQIHNDTLDNVPPAVGTEVFEYNESEGGFSTTLDLGWNNVDITVTKCKWEYLKSVEWIDRGTKSVYAILINENLNGNGRLGFFKVKFIFKRGGALISSAVIESGQLFQHEALPAPLALSCISVLVALAFLFRICHIQAKRYKRGKKQWGWFLWEALCPVFMLLTNGFYFFLVAENYDFTPFNNSSIDNTHGLLNALTLVEQHIHHDAVFRIVNAVFLIVLVSQTLYRIDFHPELSLVSTTLSTAFGDLVMFFLVFFFIVFLYGLIGMLLFGGESRAFSTFLNSCGSLMFASLGEFSFLTDTLVSDNIEDNRFASVLFMWSFVFLSTILMLNILLSIVVESFLTFQQQRRSERILTLRGSFQMFVYVLQYDIRNAHGCSKSKRPRVVIKYDSQKSEASSSSVSEEKELWTAFYVKSSHRTVREFFTKPHRFFQYIKEVSKYSHQLIPAYIVRTELKERGFSESACDRLLAIIRDRSVQTRSNTETQEQKLMFHDKASYQNHILHKILNKLDENTPNKIAMRT